MQPVSGPPGHYLLARLPDGREVVACVENDPQWLVHAVRRIQDSNAAGHDPDSGDVRTALCGLREPEAAR